MQAKLYEGGIDIKKEVSFEDLAGYVRLLVNLYSAFHVERKKWLSERAKDFYVASVICVINGHRNPKSPESIAIYKEIFGNSITKAAISDYINKCRNLEWIVYDVDKKKMKVAPLFECIDPSGFQMNFTISTAYAPGQEEESH